MHHYHYNCNLLFCLLGPDSLRRFFQFILGWSKTEQLQDLLKLEKNYSLLYNVIVHCPLRQICKAVPSTAAKSYILHSRSTHFLLGYVGKPHIYTTCPYRFWLSPRPRAVQLPQPLFLPAQLPEQFLLHIFWFKQIKLWILVSPEEVIIFLSYKVGHDQ